jgi:hypothetical protein
MTEIDAKRFASAMQALGEYYGRQLSKAAVRLYWQGLMEFDILAIERAIGEHMRNPDTGQFLPKIADVVRVIHGRTEDQSLAAWAKVDRAVRSVGGYQSVVFDDPIVHRVISDMGGWVALCAKRDDEWPFVAKEFGVRYRAFRLRGETPEYPRQLIGIAEAHNSSKGLPSDPPTLVGNQAAAERVMLGGTDRPLVAFTRAATAVPRIEQAVA